MIKYGIWKTRYTQNVAATYEDWVRQEGAPHLFCSEMSALEAKHSEEMKNNDINTEFEVREIEVSA